MNSTSKKTGFTRCPICGNADVLSKIQTEQFEQEFEDKKYSIVAENVPVQSCSACGEEWSGPEAGRIRDEALCRALGFLTPREIQSLREGLGLSQAELGQLTGIGETSISRWERGQLIQSRALDRFLRLIQADPHVLETLRKLTSSQPPSPPSQTPLTFPSAPVLTKMPAPVE